jgi:hypothetical protein
MDTDTIPVASPLPPAWEDALIVLGALCWWLIAFFCALYLAQKEGTGENTIATTIRRRLSRTIQKKRQRHQAIHPATTGERIANRPTNPTLAETGGLHPSTNLTNSRHRHCRCNTAAPSPAKAPPTSRSPSFCCRAPNATPCPRSTPSAAKVDDVADKSPFPVEKRREQLAEWRDDVRRACENQSPQFAVNQELQPVIQAIRPAV